MFATPDSITLDETTSPIKAVAVSEEDIMAEMARLDAEAEAEQAAADAEQQRRADTIAALDVARQEAENRCSLSRPS